MTDHTTPAFPADSAGADRSDPDRGDHDDTGAELDLAAVFDRVEQMLLGGPRLYTRGEVAEVAGTESDAANQLWRALGFATVDDEEVVFNDGDVAALRSARYLEETGIVDDELRTAMTRMVGQTFSRLAAWQGELLTEMFTARPDLLESEERLLGFIERLLPVIESIQMYVWRRQLWAYLARNANPGMEVAIPGQAPVAVGFADLSRFTILTRKATEAELRDLLEGFEAAATEAVGRHGGRIVKTIGDEVMFVADTPAAGAEIALDLLETAAKDQRLPPLRIGIAAGPVVRRLGDVFGSTVNIASRLTSISRPGWVLVDRVMAESLREDERFYLKSRRPESVGGFHHLRQWRLRRPDQVRPPVRGH